jgi:PHS family inorganic phosphate transporter-like MFS transporter
MMAAVFSMQGLGQVAAAIVMLVLSVAFKSQLLPSRTIAECDAQCLAAVDRMWRLLIGLGGVPACIALYCKSCQWLFFEGAVFFAIHLLSVGAWMCAHPPCLLNMPPRELSPVT